MVGGIGPQHHGDKGQPIPLRRGGDAAARLAGGAGFQPGDALVGADEFVGVHQLGFPAPHGVHPGEGVVEDLLVVDELPAHQSHVVGAGDVALLVQTVAVFEHGVVHAQLLGLFVHLGHKGLLAAGHRLGQHHGGVVGAHNHRGLDEVVHGHGLPLLQPDIRAAHGGRVSRGSEGLVQGETAAVDGLEHQAECHHLGDGGAGAQGVGVLLKEHPAGGGLHQHGGGGGELQALGPGRQGGQQQGGGNRQGEQGKPKLFYREPSFLGAMERICSPPRKKTPKARLGCLFAQSFFSNTPHRAGVRSMGCSVLQFLGAGRAAPYALRAVRVLPWFLFSAAPCKTLGALPPNPCKLF